MAQLGESDVPRLPSEADLWLGGGDTSAGWGGLPTSNNYLGEYRGFRPRPAWIWSGPVNAHCTLRVQDLACAGGGQCQDRLNVLCLQRNIHW